MFKHRLSKFGKASLFVACMILVGGMFQSCKDEYFYDDREPEWLGASIYDFLKTGSPGHTYSCYVELIDSLGEKETLSHTGSKTLFVADDAAFARFFENNPWGVKSIAEMTKAQMKYIFYSSMLDNAMLLDMLSSTYDAKTQKIVEGAALRRTTSISVLDTIPVVKADEMPKYNKFWDILYDREKADDLLLVKGANSKNDVPMMVHFLKDYLGKNNVTASDIEFLFKKNGVQEKTYTDGEAFIFGSKLVASDVPTDGFSDDTMTITCKNGYVYRLDEVLLPPSNMAEELSLREDVKIVSHLLDRFCIPVFDANITSEYKSLYKGSERDSVFTLRYITRALRESGITELSKLSDAKKSPSIDEELIFDPGSNNYGGAENMGAMFVPTDESLYNYFATGAGNFYIENFAKDAAEKVQPDFSPENVPAMLQALDSIPESLIATLLNNMMQAEFTTAVRSKFDLLMNDAKEGLGVKGDDVTECIIANNGVVYLLNKVFAPAKYEAVYAPATVYEHMRIINNTILQLRYDYYLLAMEANYSFVIPSDNHFVYHDPITFVTNAADEPLVYDFHFDVNRKLNNSHQKAELWATVHSFDKNTYLLKDSLYETSNAGIEGKRFGGGVGSGAHPLSQDFMRNRMTDIMDYLIIVHEKNDGLLTMVGNDWVVNKPERKYYRTKGYGTIKIDATDPTAIKFYGGEQLEQLDNGMEIVASSVHSQKNGFAFCTVPSGEPNGRLLSGVPTPPTKNVYTNMYAHAANEGDLYYEFFNLCNNVDLEEIMLKNEAFTEEDEETGDFYVIPDSMKMYSIFYSSEDAKYNNVVPFFNIFHYSVYIPSNASLQKMYAKGLPTREDVKKYADDPETWNKAFAMTCQINDFVRYHFQDNSIFVDGVDFSISGPNGVKESEADYSSAVINPKTGRFYSINVSSEAGTIKLVDQLGRKAYVVTTGEENKDWNVMARDIQFDVSNEIPTGIANSSFSVLQPIDNVLLNEGMFGYDGLFARFANNGAKVDTMSVAGIAGLANVAGRTPYLIGARGTVTIPNKDGVEANMRIGYLMEPVSPVDAFTKEALVLDENSEPILVTNEGFRIKEILEGEDDNSEESDETEESEEREIVYETSAGTFAYYTELGSDGKKYILKMKNDGTVDERVEFVVPATQE